ncbi:MAG: ribosome assembly cofactor RimP [Candidatus Aphodosoma sp.]
MIQKEIIENLVNARIEGTRYFLVGISVSADNNIAVEIDSADGVDIDFCADLSRFLESGLDREVEDFSLEVGSAGLTSPFKVLRQWQNSIGREVEVLDGTGTKHRGVVAEVSEAGFSIDETVMERREGDKRKRQYVNRVSFEYEKIKYTKYTINLK